MKEFEEGIIGVPDEPNRSAFLLVEHPFLRNWIQVLLLGLCYLTCDGPILSAINENEFSEIPEVDFIVLELDSNYPATIDFADRLARTQRAKIVVIALSLNDYIIHRVMGMGVKCFIDLASDDPERIKQFFFSLKKESSYYSVSIIQRAIEMRANQVHFAKILSDREMKILSDIACGWDDDRIALNSLISPSTVKSYRSRLIRKLNVKGTSGLIIYAREIGLL